MMTIIARCSVWLYKHNNKQQKAVVIMIILTITITLWCTVKTKIEKVNIITQKNYKEEIDSCDDDDGGEVDGT